MAAYKTISRTRYLLVVAVLLGAYALASQSPGRVALAWNQQPADSETRAPKPASDTLTQALIADLKQSGFQVSEGFMALYTVQECYDNTYPKLKNCFLSNAAAPYLLPVLKSWPDEYVDPAVVDAFLETEPGFNVTYRLDQREAIVMYGQMPPPGRYMGWQTFVFSEQGKWKPRDYDQWANTPDLIFPIQYLFDTIPPDDPKSRRVISMSAVGDVINNVVMERQLNEDPFEKTLYFITTPSAATDRAVRLALQEQGVPDSHIFTEQIPRRDDLGPIGPIGSCRNAIDFFTAFRYAVPEDPDAADAWREDPPLKVLRVRAPDSLGPVQRYASLTFAPRTGNDEACLAGDLEKLVFAVCDSVMENSNLMSTDCVQQPPPSESFMTDPVFDNGWIGPYCRDIGMDCQGDQQEATYYTSTPRPLDSGQVYAIIDTLATETGNAIYVGVSANDASILAGVANVLDTELKGSADCFKDAGGVDRADKFFVHYFTRDCSVLENVPCATGNCTEITEEMLPPAGDTTAQGDPDLLGMAIFTIRNYIAQGTRSGPDSSKILRPRIITFTP